MWVTCLHSWLTKVRIILLPLTRLSTLPHVRCRLVQPVCIWLRPYLLFLRGGCKITWWKWHVWSAQSMMLELICHHWPDLQFFHMYVGIYSLFALVPSHMFKHTWWGSWLMRLEICCDHWPDLPLCHMWDAGLFSQFVLELDHMLLLWRGCKLTWWEGHVW